MVNCDRSDRRLKIVRIKKICIVISLLLAMTGCSAPSRSIKHSPPYTLRLSSCETEYCFQAFQNGEGLYYSYRYRDALDSENFYKAREYYEIAAGCAKCEYQDDSLFALANCFFYIGDFRNAAKVYRLISKKFSDSDYWTYSSNQADLIDTCIENTHALDAYRKALLYELHGDESMAMKYYENAYIESDYSYNCEALRHEAGKKLYEMMRPIIEKMMEKMKENTGQSIPTEDDTSNSE